MVAECCDTSGLPQDHSCWETHKPRLHETYILQWEWQTMRKATGPRALSPS
jgi:hypothetical protein